VEHGVALPTRARRRLNGVTRMTTNGNWFIALPVSATAAPPQLDDLPRVLERFAVSDLHVTIAFLGRIDAATAWGAWHSASRIEAGPIRAHARGRLTLGSPRRPSACGLELDDDAGRIAAIIERHRDALRAVVGLPPEDRDALPHVTLGRVPRKRRLEGKAAVKSWVARGDAEAWRTTLDRIGLYTRASDRRSRYFARVAERPLGERAPPS